MKNYLGQNLSSEFMQNAQIQHSFLPSPYQVFQDYIIFFCLGSDLHERISHLEAIMSYKCIAFKSTVHTILKGENEECLYKV